jgi:ubiquinone/menaquinone biosynthesis C-methylase UbiE
MQDNTGIKKMLSISWIYDVFQDLVGAKKARTWLAENYWKLNNGNKVVDLGCGPGGILDHLPKKITYIGIDISEEYIKTAKNRYGAGATFIVSTARKLLDKPDERLNNADLVLCNGLLHHLDDTEAKEILQLSSKILAPTGKLVCFEPTYLVKQGLISKWIMNKDRGRNIRTEQEWKELVNESFESFETTILTNLIRIPYVHIVIQCHK